MIQADQPTIFNADVVAAVSSKSDGTMKFGTGDDKVLIMQNRKAFLHKVGVAPEHTTLVRVSYDDAEHFARYRIVADTEKFEGMSSSKAGKVADALVVTKPGHALFLLLADCTGVILYDPKKRVLMLSHVGRHSAEIDGAAKSVAYLRVECAVDPATLRVWLSPAVGKAAYPLRAMGGKGLHEVIYDQLILAGVQPGNIQKSTVDTVHSDYYFSHSQFLAGNPNDNGRFAVVAMMRERGEPAL